MNVHALHALLTTVFRRARRVLATETVLARRQAAEFTAAADRRRRNQGPLR